MNMRTLLLETTCCALIGGAVAAAEIPERDDRNVTVPNTDTHFTMPASESRAAWEAHKAEVRERILWAAGLLPMPEKTPLNPQIWGRIDRDGYSVEKTYIETLPGYFLAGNLYRPAKRSGRVPGILLAHGHWQYGRLEEQPLYSAQTLAANLTLQGNVVFMYDMVGYNDTIQTPHRFRGAREELWSFTPLGLQLWNSTRALDFLLSLDSVDPERIGMTGASGGGTQTFLLAAVDDRVRYPSPVNMVSAIMQGGDVCENAPGLRLGTFNVEIAAMAAPRPMLLVSATGDWTRNAPVEEFPAIRRIYEMYGAADRVSNVHVDAEHNFNHASREAVYRYFGRYFQPSAPESAFAEREIAIEQLQDMLVFHGRPLPAGALNYEQLFAQWRDRATRDAEKADHETLRRRLQLALAAESPAKVEARVDGEQIVLGRPGKGDRVPGFWIPGKGAAVVVVDVDGAAAARGKKFVGDLIRARRPVLLLDAFQTGSAVAPRDRSHRYFLTFNRSDDANRVRDILTAVAWLRSSGHSEIELAGEGRAGVWCLFAAACAVTPVKLAGADWKGFGGADRDFESSFFVPGIQKAGGVTAARRILGQQR